MTSRTVATVPRAELVDVVQRVEIGDARETQHRSCDEGDPGVAPLQQPHRKRLGRLSRLSPRPRLGVLLRAASLLKRSVAPRSQHERNPQRQHADEDVLQRTDRVLRGALGAGTVQHEHDQQTERDARRIGAEQVAQHQPSGVREQQHHCHRRKQRRVDRRHQRQQDDVDQVAAHTCLAELQPVPDRSNQASLTTPSSRRHSPACPGFKSPFQRLNLPALPARPEGVRLSV
jgi:hypothetical protein